MRSSYVKVSTVSHSFERLNTLLFNSVYRIFCEWSRSTEQNIKTTEDFHNKFTNYSMAISHWSLSNLPKYITHGTHLENDRSHEKKMVHKLKYIPSNVHLRCTISTYQLWLFFPLCVCNLWDESEHYDL